MRPTGKPTTTGPVDVPNDCLDPRDRKAWAIIGTKVPTSQSGVFPALGPSVVMPARETS